MCDICERNGIDYEARWPWAPCARPPAPSRPTGAQGDIGALVDAISDLVSEMRTNRPQATIRPAPEPLSDSDGLDL